MSQIEMFKLVVNKLNDFQIKFINTEIWDYKNNMEDLLEDYEYDFFTINSWSMGSVRKVLDFEKPDIIVTGHDQILMDILFIECANNKKIPSLTVQDGIFGSNKSVNHSLPCHSDNSLYNKISFLINIPLRILFFFIRDSRPFRYKSSIMSFNLKYKKDHPLVHGHGKSTKIAVFGNAVKKVLTSESVNPKKLVITGNPKFDVLSEYKNENNNTNMLKRKWNIPTYKIIVLILTQWLVEAKVWTEMQRKEFIVSIAKATSKIENLQLILKIRPPYESVETYSDILKEINVDAIIFDKEPIAEILNISDIVITAYSTASLEAMILNKKVLIVNLFKEDHAMFFKDSGALYIEDKKDILPSLQQLIHSDAYNKEMNEFVNDQAYLIDGKASERIANLIRKMVQK